MCLVMAWYLCLAPPPPFFFLSSFFVVCPVWQGMCGGSICFLTQLLKPHHFYANGKENSNIFTQILVQCVFLCCLFDQDISIGTWQLQHTAGEQETTFKFHRSLVVKAGKTVTVSYYACLLTSWLVCWLVDSFKMSISGPYWLVVVFFLW